MGPIWGWRDPGKPHVGPMNFAIWAILLILLTENICLCLSLYIYTFISQSHVTHLCDKCHMSGHDKVPNVHRAMCLRYILKTRLWLMLHGTHDATYISSDNLKLNNAQWSLGTQRSFGLFDVSNTDLSQQKHPMLDVGGLGQLLSIPPLFSFLFIKSVRPGCNLMALLFVYQRLVYISVSSLTKTPYNQNPNAFFGR